MKLLERNWTDVGSEYNSEPAQRERLAGIFDSLDWEPMRPEGLSWPMMPAMAIDAAIKELRIPNILAVARSNEMSPYGLVAVRARYKNGTAQIYLLDEGSNVTVLASDLYETPKPVVSPKDLRHPGTPEVSGSRRAS